MRGAGADRAAGLRARARHRRATLAPERLLSRVDLAASSFERYPHEFSGGQPHRIGIARALMFDPELIVADEAVSALDVSVQAQILDLLAEIEDEMELAMIFVTHDLRVASRICDAVVVMQNGRMVESGPPACVAGARSMVA